MEGHCPVCEIWSRESQCFVCGGKMLYGIPESVSGGKPHHYVDALRVVEVGANWIVPITEPNIDLCPRP